MVARVLVSAFILLLAGGVVFLMFHDPAPVCSICNRPILDATTCTVTLVKGDVVPLCCPRCTMRFEQDRDDVKSTEVSDFYSGEKLPITGAVYVEGSQVHPCCDHKGVQMDRSGAQYEMTWDRCLPSLIAFKSPEDASEFSLMYGGKVRTFGDLKVGRPESE